MAVEYADFFDEQEVELVSACVNCKYATKKQYYSDHSMVNTHCMALEVIIDKIIGIEHHYKCLGLDPRTFSCSFFCEEMDEDFLTEFRGLNIDRGNKNG